MLRASASVYHSVADAHFRADKSSLVPQKDMWCTRRYQAAYILAQTCYSSLFELLIGIHEPARAEVHRSEVRASGTLHH